MNVSIIIPVLNDYHALKQLMPSLTQEGEANNVDLIICDGGSVDLTCSYVRQLESKNQSTLTVKLVEGASGRAKQMNAGAQYARYDLLLFLHADTQLPKGWAGLIEGKTWGRFNVRLSGQHFMLRIIETMINWRSCFTQIATGDQAIFVQKTLFKQVSGYPALPLMEDVAFSKLLRRIHPMSCIKSPLITSSRRWENNGIFKTVILMWRLRWAYFFGACPSQLAKQYYPNHGVIRCEAIIQIFTKLPILGFVKTRLIPKLGAQQATNIHRYLLKHTLNAVKNSQIKAEMWVAQEKEHKLENDDEFLTYDSIPQKGDDLGERMGIAIKQGLKTHQKVILMGTDCLDITSEYLMKSKAALDDVDVVLTPVADGGFIIIACRVFDGQLFEKVAWGTSTALADVLKNIKKLSLSYQLLEPVRDIDTYDDVAEYSELLNLSY